VFISGSKYKILLADNLSHSGVAKPGPARAQVSAMQLCAPAI